MLQWHSPGDKGEKNLELSGVDNLVSYPEGLENNKVCIDEWINRLIIQSNNDAL